MPIGVGGTRSDKISMEECMLMGYGWPTRVRLAARERVIIFGGNKNKEKNYKRKGKKIKIV